jgi:hypothetical protein
VTAKIIPFPAMSLKLVDAVHALVEAVLVEHCHDVDVDTAVWNEARTVDCALAVLKEVRAAQGLSSLHGWADTQLAAHADNARLVARILRGGRP